ncbi:4Fe-4S dicluster domain-containing protein [Campylobacter sp. RM16187]|uniref:4Fe-4S dicluster domain-containing protein n=1 Tax=Campylobacter sp. RM16187 TaxID=1660063 RepID=UPI0021B5D66F|nr:4Fe-4S dicluster domain-containing protein [Campylobacter sp. RM16187]QKG29948.1 menaquinol dehydrogenase NosGH, periplasmic component NosG [Campylobacter sp. RM16187]
MNRRQFGAFSIVSLALGFGIGKILPSSHANELYLRPPGAVSNFETLCIKCGQCVQVCPYHSIDLLDISTITSVGTSYIKPEIRGCYLCDLFPCVLACPSGALDHDTTQISDVKMGIALLENQNACLAFKKEQLKQSDVTACLERKTRNEREEAVKDRIKSGLGTVCDLCVILCPVGSEAISMKEINEGKILPQIKEKCVGCGVCAEVCPPKIIKIIPNKNFSQIYKEG